MIRKLKEQMSAFLSSLYNKETASTSLPSEPQDHPAEPSISAAPVLETVAEPVEALSPEALAVSEFQAEAVVVPQGVLNASQGPMPVYNEYFQSRFNGWMRTIALSVIIVFVPNQISWAFNYNPAILYGSAVPSVESMAMATPAEQAALMVSGSVNHLLGQVIDRPLTRIELKVDDGINKGGLFRKAPEYVLNIDTNAQFNARQAGEIRSWLSDPSIHHLNCGVYALKDILDAKGIKKTPEEVSVMTVSLDLMSGIVKPGDKTLKTSLFAITRVAQAFKLDPPARSWHSRSSCQAGGLIQGGTGHPRHAQNRPRRMPVHYPQEQGSSCCSHQRSRPF